MQVKGDLDLLIMRLLELSAICIALFSLTGSVVGGVLFDRFPNKEKLFVALALILAGISKLLYYILIINLIERITLNLLNIVYILYLVRLFYVKYSSCNEIIV